MYMKTCGALAAYRSLDNDLSARWRLPCNEVEHVEFGIEHPLHAPHAQGRAPPLRLLVLNHDLHETLIVGRYAAPATKGERPSSLWVWWQKAAPSLYVILISQGNLEETDVEHKHSDEFSS
jgi:hypothetical protein